jgi:hypothetical protein
MTGIFSIEILIEHAENCSSQSKKNLISQMNINAGKSENVDNSKNLKRNRQNENEPKSNTSRKKSKKPMTLDKYYKKIKDSTEMVLGDKMDKMLNNIISSRDIKYDKPKENFKLKMFRFEKYTYNPEIGEEVKNLWIKRNFTYDSMNKNYSPKKEMSDKKNTVNLDLMKNTDINKFLKQYKNTLYSNDKHLTKAPIDNVSDIDNLIHVILLNLYQQSHLEILLDDVYVDDENNKTKHLVYKKENAQKLKELKEVKEVGEIAKKLKVFIDKYQDKFKVSPKRIEELMTLHNSNYVDFILIINKITDNNDKKYHDLLKDYIKMYKDLTYQTELLTQSENKGFLEKIFHLKEIKDDTDDNVFILEIKKNDTKVVMEIDSENEDTVTNYIHIDDNDSDLETITNEDKNVTGVKKTNFDIIDKIQDENSKNYDKNVPDIYSYDQNYSILKSEDTEDHSSSNFKKKYINHLKDFIEKINETEVLRKEKMPQIRFEIEHIIKNIEKIEIPIFLKLKDEMFEFYNVLIKEYMKHVIDIYVKEFSLDEKTELENFVKEISIP